MIDNFTAKQNSAVRLCGLMKSCGWKNSIKKEKVRYWANHNPNLENNCKQQGGRGIMCAGLA